jgi:lysine-specific demethylase 3
MEKLLANAPTDPGAYPPPDIKSDPSTPPAHDFVHIDEVPSHEPKRFQKGQLSEDIFRHVWAKGEPFAVENLQSGFELPWTPAYFVEKYKDQECVLIECQTDENKRTTVGQFFEMFGKYDTREAKCWKLKVTGIFHFLRRTRLKYDSGLSALCRFQVHLSRVIQGF